jgi:hypothetical protein
VGFYGREKNSKGVAVPLRAEPEIKKLLVAGQVGNERDEVAGSGSADPFCDRPDQILAHGRRKARVNARKDFNGFEADGNQPLSDLSPDLRGENMKKPRGNVLPVLSQSDIRDGDLVHA